MRLMVVAAAAGLMLGATSLRAAEVAEEPLAEANGFYLEMRAVPLPPVRPTVFEPVRRVAPERVAVAKVRPRPVTPRSIDQALNEQDLGARPPAAKRIWMTVGNGF